MLLHVVQHKRFLLLTCGACVGFFMLLFGGIVHRSQERERMLQRHEASQGRLHPSPSVATIVDAERKPMAERSVVVTLTSEQKTPVSVSLSIKDHPQWVRVDNGMFGSVERVDTEAIRTFLEQEEGNAFRVMRPVEILSVATDSHDVLRATTTGAAKPGYAYDTASAARQIAQALMDEQREVHIDATYSDPFVTITMSDGQVKHYELLATGLSDFADSEAGRESNVHKVIDERVHNVLVPAGETFSLIAALDVPITLEKGWKEALGLFGGGAALTVGGGICQSATTIYRAALLAGLPIVEKRNHSLFVDHYEFYGVGLDATVFPGFHDVRYRNDTGSELLMQAYTEGVTVSVNIFGRSDGRTTHLDGPYFARSKDRPPALRPLSNHQIGWVRTVTFADGNAATQPLISTYAKPVWNSILKKYDGADGMMLLATRDGKK